MHGVFVVVEAIGACSMGGGDFLLTDKRGLRVCVCKRRRRGNCVHTASLVPLLLYRWCLLYVEFQIRDGSCCIYVFIGCHV